MALLQSLYEKSFLIERRFGLARHGQWFGEQVMSCPVTSWFEGGICFFGGALEPGELQLLENPFLRVFCRAVRPLGSALLPGTADPLSTAPVANIQAQPQPARNNPHRQLQPSTTSSSQIQLNHVTNWIQHNNQHQQSYSTMTTAHRPTFDPARGKEALRGPAYHQRLLPAHTQLKFRQAGQGGDADDIESRDLRAELLAAEAAHFAKKNGTPLPLAGGDDSETISGGLASKRPLELTAGGEEDLEAKRRRILEESRDIDADSEEDDEDDSDDSSEDDSDDEEAELQRELEKIKAERAAKRQKEEEERAAAEQEEREKDIALGNPLLNKQNFDMKRRWDDDVVFKNQARGTEEKGKKKEFVNDLLRSDFHKRFMGKYVR